MPRLSRLLVPLAAVALGALAAPTGAQRSKLLAADGAPFDLFGTSVATSHKHVAVGALLADGADFNTGKVYIWRRSPGGLARDASLTPSQSYINDHFGRSLDFDGDVLAIGSDSSDGGLFESRGAVHIFRHIDGTWVEGQRLVPESLTPLASFGWALDLRDDLLIVGARGLSTDETQDGGAFVFRWTDGEWVESPMLRPADPQEDHLFGHAVQVQGRVAAIAALGDNQYAIQAGAVYIFGYDDAHGWVEQQKLASHDIANWDGFGESIALDREWLAVGTPSDDEAGVSTGAVYLYRRQGQLWSLQQKLLAPDAQLDGWFGRSVALEGTTLAVGALNGGAGPALSGAVYVYEWGGVEWRSVPVELPAELLAAGELGTDVAVHGHQILAGAPRDPELAQMAGAAYLIDTQTGGPVTEAPTPFMESDPTGFTGWLRRILR